MTTSREAELLTVAGREVSISHPDKVLFPKPGYTKLDLAKAYEEMGDKDGARELLNEVMKDGDAAQKGTAQQLLAKLS